jgi:hypothetical protein
VADLRGRCIGEAKSVASSVRDEVAVGGGGASLSCKALSWVSKGLGRILGPTSADNLLRSKYVLSRLVMLVLDVSLSEAVSISSNRPCEVSSSSRPFPLPLGGRRRRTRGSGITGDNCRVRLRFNERIGETVCSSSELGVAERALPFAFDFIRPRALDKAGVSTSSPSENSEATGSLGIPPLPLPTPLFLPLPLVGARTCTTDRDVEAIEASLLAVKTGDCDLISSGW